MSNLRYQQSRTPAYLLVFLMLLVPCTAFVSSQVSVEAPAKETHAPAILVDGLPPLLCGDEICERPLREYVRDDRPASQEYGWWNSYGPDLDWNGMDDRLQRVLDGMDSISPTAIIGPDGKKTVAIVGSTGSGKSTLAYLLPRLYDIESGKIEIDGVDIHNVKLDELRSQVSLAFEESFLFSNSARENISLGSDEASQEQIENAALIARAHEFIAQLPESYETKVGERGYGLSGGQRQRLSIARAIAKDSPILILDEATSALDSATEKLVQSAINKMQKGRTTIIIAHRLSTIKNADRIIVIKDGEIIEQGTHSELIEASGEYLKLTQQQT